MGLIQLVVILAVIGLIVWAIENYIPMPQPFRIVIRVVVVIVLILFLMKVFGVADIPIGR